MRSGVLFNSYPRILINLLFIIFKEFFTQRTYRILRYWVYFSPAKRNQKILEEFHEQRLGGNLAAGFLADLLNRGLSKFNPLINNYQKISFPSKLTNFPFNSDLVVIKSIINFAQLSASI